MNVRYVGDWLSRTTGRLCGLGIAKSASRRSERVTAAAYASMSEEEGGPTCTRSPSAERGGSSATGSVRWSDDNATSQHDAERVRHDGDVLARIGCVDDEVGVLALDDARASEPLAGAPGGGGEHLGAAQPCLGQLDHLLRDQPVREAAARVRADVDGHAGLVRRAHRRVAALVQVEHVAVVAGELLL